jgi:hypothetical protein
MRVAGSQQETAKALQLRLTNDNFHQPFAETFFPVFFYNKYIGEVGESGLVGYHACKTYLAFTMKNAKTKRTFNGFLHCGDRYTLCPVGLRNKLVDNRNIHFRFVCCDGEFVFLPVHNGARYISLLLMQVHDDLQTRWWTLEAKLVERFGKKPDMETILFLIGIQEFGDIKGKFSKEQKQDLMHVAVCSLLSQSGYYELEQIDEDGWPHFKQLKSLPVNNLVEQENFLKDHILLYFERIGF